MRLEVNPWDVKGTRVRRVRKQYLRIELVPNRFTGLIIQIDMDMEDAELLYKQLDMYFGKRRGRK